MADLSPDDLALLESELGREDLQIYTVVVMARRDIGRGNVEAAIARLRVDADKLRCFDTPINRLISIH